MTTKVQLTARKETIPCTVPYETASLIQVNMFANTREETVFTCCNKTELLFPNLLQPLPSSGIIHKLLNIQKYFNYTVLKNCNLPDDIEDQGKILDIMHQQSVVPNCPWLKDTFSECLLLCGWQQDFKRQTQKSKNRVHQPLVWKCYTVFQNYYRRQFPSEV